jgi:hypothetical protein
VSNPLGVGMKYSVSYPIEVVKVEGVGTNEGLDPGKMVP